MLYGDPKEKDDGLYPLPPNAYKSKSKEESPSSSKDSGEDAESRSSESNSSYAEKAAIQKKLSWRQCQGFYGDISFWDSD